MKKRIVIVGMARSGTMAAARLAANLSLDARHQDLPGPADAELFPYDLDAPPPCVAAKARRYAAAAPPFNASWGLSYYMKLMADAAPDLDIYIATRAPEKVCNSLRHYRQVVNKRPPNPLSYFVRLYGECYAFLVEQARRMDPKPHWYDAEALFAGRYDQAVIDAWAGATNYREPAHVRHFFQHRTNHHGEYPVDTCPQMAQARALKAKLESICPELGSEES